MRLSDTENQRNQYEAVVNSFWPGNKLLRIWPLDGGISAEMTAVEVEDRSGRKKKVIFRHYGKNQLLKHPMTAENEYKLLQLTSKQGLNVPKPLYFEDSDQVLSSPYLVLEYIEGHLDFMPADLEDYLSQFAVKLAKIHALDLSKLDFSFLPIQQGECLELARVGPEKIDSLAESRIREALNAVQPIGVSNTQVLLHADYWPGNVLWRDGRLAAVIDWEDARIGDPLFDLARSRSEIAWILGIEALELFTAYYQASQAIDYGNLPYWDLCAALRFIRFFGTDLGEAAEFFVPFGRSKMTEQTIIDNFNYFLSQALERLEARSNNC